jgi:hypothetical protein
VKNTATRIRRTTGNCAQPTDAASPSACGVSRVPAGRITESWRMSSPCAAIHSPAFGVCRIDRVAVGRRLLLHHDGIGAGRHRRR